MNHGPGQWLARWIIRRAQQQAERGTEVKVHWVLGHMGIEGNEEANKAAKKEAEKTGTRRCPEQIVSLAHIGRTIRERKWKEAKHRLRAKNERRPLL